METDREITHFSVSTTGYHSNRWVIMVTDDSIMFNLNNAYFLFQDINFFSLVMEQGMVQRHHIIHIKAKNSIIYFRRNDKLSEKQCTFQFADTDTFSYEYRFETHF